ncbi:MAG: S1C family serine protease [Aerococcus sp.]|nr:S1C family serine protease [Aerococcus sp.]
MADNPNTNPNNDPKDAPNQTMEEASTNNNQSAPTPEHNNKPTRSHHYLKTLIAPAVIGGLCGVLLYGVQQQVSGGSVSRSEVESMLQSNAQDTTSNKKQSQSANQEQQASLDVTTDVSDIVSRVSGAVVSVENLSQKNDVYDLFGFANPNNRNEEQSTTDNDSDEYSTASEGSGVVYKKENGKAYIVTNYHVVSGSDALEVIMPSGKQVRVKLVGADPWTDLAVMEMPEADAEGVAELGDSDALKVGEPAIAIGSPLGSDFASTVTTGIISGLKRQVPTDIDGDGKSDWTATAIQTDAAINPGNSGGALVNSAGQLIGINSMKISNSQVEGMGFAIPANEVKEIVEQLEKNGRVVRPELGVSTMSLYQLPLDQQESVLKLPSSVEDGAVVTDVKANSPASSAGLKEYDVITKVGDTAIKDSVQLRQVLYSQKSNAKVKITYYRDGKEATADVQLKPMENNVETKSNTGRN